MKASGQLEVVTPFDGNSSKYLNSETDNNKVNRSDQIYIHDFETVGPSNADKLECHKEQNDAMVENMENTNKETSSYHESKKIDGNLSGNDKCNGWYVENHNQTSEDIHKLNRGKTKLNRIGTPAKSIVEYQIETTNNLELMNGSDDDKNYNSKEEGELTESETSSPIPLVYKKLPYENRVRNWCTCNIFTFKKTLPVSEELLKSYDIEKARTVNEPGLLLDSDTDDLIFVGEIHRENVIHEIETGMNKNCEDVIDFKQKGNDAEIIDNGNSNEYVHEKTSKNKKTKHNTAIESEDIVITFNNENALSKCSDKFGCKEPGKVKELNRVYSTKPQRRKINEQSILCIANLIQPFTLAKLNALLQKTGKIVANGFWLDSNKLKCYVQYETVSEAIKTKHALNNLHWPAHNPNVLDVRFVTKDDFVKAQAETDIIEVPQKTESPHMKLKVDKQRNLKHAEEQNSLKLHARVREWDIGKPKNPDEIIYPEHRNTHIRTSARNKQSHKDLTIFTTDNKPPEKLRKIEELHIKTLDELFRRTKTVPNLYWLPLNNEQVMQRTSLRF